MQRFNCEATQEPGLCADPDRDRQAPILSRGVPRDGPDSSASPRPERKQPGGIFTPDSPTEGAQTTTLQITRLCTALPLHSRRHPEYLLSPTSSSQSTHLQRAAGRLIQDVDRRVCLRLIPPPRATTLQPNGVNVSTPMRGLPDVARQDCQSRRAGKASVEGGGIACLSSMEPASSLA